ncbi:MAG: hypothetical protein ACJAZP_000707 [Psychromonas sp.]
MIRRLLLALVFHHQSIKENSMAVVEIVIVLAIWFASGHAIEKIYSKAGFKDTPKFVFWIPALNLAFLLYLAFIEWPRFREEL